MTLNSCPLRVKTVFALVACFCLMAPGALAQDDLDFSDMSLEDLLNVEVTVASKSAETLDEAPSTVTVFTRQEILNLGITTLEELLNYVPGFQVARTEEDVIKTQTASVRGRRTNSTTQDVLFLMDGQRLNDELTGGALTINNHMTLANVKQVEIIRGPGSALYGSNAFLGVVNIVTDTEMSEAYVGSGSFGAFEAYAGVSHKSDDWSISAFARSYSDDGDTYNQYLDLIGNPTPTNDPLDSQDMYVALQYKDLRLNVRRAERNQEDFVLIGNVANDLNFADVEVNSYNLSYQITSNDRWDVKVGAGFLESELRDLVPLFAAGVAQDIGFADRPDLVIGGDVQKVEQTSFNWDNAYNFSNEKTSISFGASWRDASIEQWTFLTNFDAQALFALELPFQIFDDISDVNGGPRGNIEDPLGAGSRDILGVYAQAKHRFNEKLVGTVGIRYDDYSDFGSTTNPRGALVWKPMEKTTLKVLYGEAFRAPTPKEQSELSLTFVGNPDLEPEEVSTAEIAWVQKWGEKAQTTLTYYDSEITGGVVIAPLQSEGFTTLTPQNLLTVDLSGIELEASVAFSENLFFKFAYGQYIDTEEEPQQFPDTTMSFILNYHNGPWNWNFNGYFHDKVDGSASELDSFWIANSTLRFNLNDKIHLQLAGQNLFDEEYYTLTNTVRVPVGLQGRGTSLQFGAGVKF